MPWSSAIRILTRPRSAAARIAVPVGRRTGRHLEPDGRALAGPGVDLERAAHEQRPLAHARRGPGPCPPRRRRTRSRCRRPASRTRESQRLEAHLDAGWRRSGATRSRAPPARPGRPRPGRRATGRRAGDPPRSWPAPGRAGRSRARACAAPPRGRGRRAPWGAAGGRGRAARPSPGRRARFTSASWAFSSGGASWAAASMRSSRAVSDWLTSSCRSRAMRLRSSSWAPMHQLPERRRSFSSRSSMRLKLAASRYDVGRDARPCRVSSSRRRPGRERSTRSIIASSRSRGSKRRRRSSVLSRNVSTNASARTRNCQRWSAIERSNPAARIDDQDARRHHQQVEGEDLAQQGGPSHGFIEPRNRRNGVARGADFGSGPHTGSRPLVDDTRTRHGSRNLGHTKPRVCGWRYATKQLKQIGRRA